MPLSSGLVLPGGSQRWGNGGTAVAALKQEPGIWQDTLREGAVTMRPRYPPTLSPQNEKGRGSGVAALTLGRALSLQEGPVHVLVSVGPGVPLLPPVPPSEGTG